MDGGCARADSEGTPIEEKKSNKNKTQGRIEKVIAHCEEEPEAGGRILPSPKRSGARARLSRGELRG